MKRFLILLSVYILGNLSGDADIIVTRLAESIDCKVVAIDDAVVKYRKTGEKFDREIPLADVFKVKYDNGDEDNFAHRTSSPSSVKDLRMESVVNTSTEPDWASLPEVSRRYQIGDWYSENGVEGIVIWTTPDGRHGRIINKEKFNNSKSRYPKAFFTGPTDICLGMTDMTNGYANMLSLKRFIRENPQYTPDMFPIQQIIDGLGDGWYLPAIKEIEYFYNLRENKVVYSGDNPEFKGKTVLWGKIFNSVSKKHGGVKHNEHYSLSSTETYSQGGATAMFETLYGDPQSPQYALYRLEHKASTKPVIRNKGKFPFYAFHLF